MPLQFRFAVKIEANHLQLQIVGVEIDKGVELGMRIGEPEFAEESFLRRIGSLEFHVERLPSQITR